MRTKLILIAASLVVTGVVTRAQQATPPAFTGSIDFGTSKNEVTGNTAGWQRYRDQRDGGAVDRIRLDWQAKGWRFDATGSRVGRRDQRVGGTFRASKLTASFAWDQTPLFRSADTRTAFTLEAPGIYRLDDGLQSGVENGLFTVSAFANAASAFDLRARRHTAAFDLTLKPTKGIDVLLNLRQTDRKGSQPWGAVFGMSNMVELAAPVDTRTRDVLAALEWAGQRGMVRVGYDGSWFTNDVQTLRWDNPFRATDGLVGTAYRSAQGQMALWPDSTSHGISTSAALKLPGRSRLAASVRGGMLRQNAPLLPVTINSAIPAVALPRETADAEGRTLAMNYSFTSRPSRFLWLSARYRYYDFDNRTPVFGVSQWIGLDQTPHGATETAPLSATRQTLDVDAAFTPRGPAGFRVGYTRGATDRTHRIFERTNETTYRASIDAVRGPVTVRAIVERGERRGAGFDETPLVHAGEQPSLRHYDIADRDRQRVTGLVQLAPHPWVSLSASTSIGQDEYGASGFGLRDNENRAYTATVELTPATRFAIGATYTNERYSALQRSRQANPGVQFDDPTRNWSLDSADRADTIAVTLDALKLLPRTDIRLTYDFTHAKATYVYGLPADSTLTPLVPLPVLRNDMRSATGDVRFFVTRQVAIGAVYWYDDYAVDDFARSVAAIGTLAPTSASLFLGSVYRPYTARSASLRLLWLW